MALKSETIKDPIPPVEAPPSACGDPLKDDPPIGEWGFKTGRWIRENKTFINIADIWHNIYDTIQKALRVIPIEKNEVRWTTEADFNKGTHDKTQTIPDGGGAIALSYIPNGAYAVYHLNETSGDNVPDDSGFNRDGTRVNMEDSDWVLGKLNNCLLFDGVSEYVDCGAIANFERTDPFSLECWFKTTVDGRQLITKIDNDSPYRGWAMYIAGTKLSFQLTNNTANRIVVQGDTTNLTDGAWHHVMATYDGSSLASGVHLYVDNHLETLTVLNDTLTLPISNTINCEIAAKDGANGCFDGYIDEAIIYERELNSVEVSFRWNNGDGIEWCSGCESSGTYISNVYDSIYPNLDWDKIYFDHETPENATAVYKIRTSNDNVSWSEWSAALSNGEDITLNGRYIQWKADFESIDDMTTPKLFSMSLVYLNQKLNTLSP